LAGFQHILQKWLVHPDDAEQPGVIAYEYFEEGEATPPRSAESGADDFAAEGGGFSGFKVGGPLELAAILEPDRKPVQQVVERVHPGLLELARPPGADPFLESEFLVEQMNGRGVSVRGHWVVGSPGYWVTEQ
jgi:hypothetical protein